MFLFVYCLFVSSVQKKKTFFRLMSWLMVCYHSNIFFPEWLDWRIAEFILRNFCTVSLFHSVEMISHRNVLPNLRFVERSYVW